MALRINAFDLHCGNPTHLEVSDDEVLRSLKAAPVESRRSLWEGLRGEFASETPAATSYPLAPGSRWEGEVIVDRNGDTVRLEEDLVVCRTAHGGLTNLPYLADVLALASKAGLLPRDEAALAKLRTEVEQADGHVAVLHGALCSVIATLGGDPLDLDDQAVMRTACDLAGSAVRERDELRDRVTGLEDKDVLRDREVTELYAERTLRRHEALAATVKQNETDGRLSIVASEAHDLRAELYSANNSYASVVADRDEWRESSGLLVVERDSLRAQLEAVTKERDAARGELRRASWERTAYRSALDTIHATVIAAHSGTGG